MTPKKKIVEQFEQGESVPTQELAEAVAPAPRKKGGFVAYAPFEIGGVSYQEGDAFTPPAGWVRDEAFDEFRGSTRRHGQKLGISFYETLPPPARGEDPITRRQTLPLEEA